MMDYKELIEELREGKFDQDEELQCTPFECGAFGLCKTAATAIETLLAEREALMSEIRGECGCCVHKSKCLHDEDARSECAYSHSNNWQWRGPTATERNERIERGDTP